MATSSEPSDSPSGDPSILSTPTQFELSLDQSLSSPTTPSSVSPGHDPSIMPSPIPSKLPFEEPLSSPTTDTSVGNIPVLTNF